MTEKKNIISNNGAVDEELLKKFFADSVCMRIDDNGFAERVMQRLPEEVDARCYRMYNLWTAVMATACVVVFFLVDGFDILHNLSKVTRTVNAQGRIESYSNVLPSYFMAHVIYKLNIQPKKKK